LASYGRPTDATLADGAGTLDYRRRPGHRYSSGWILFQGVKVNEPSLSTVYVAPAAGGEWIHITDGKTWDDKPRWSPDGKTIYFASTRGTGFVNVWGIRFDSFKGKTVSEPFQITAFESPGQMIFPGMGLLQISLTENRLVVPMMQVSGSVWILENVDR